MGTREKEHPFPFWEFSNCGNPIRPFPQDYLPQRTNQMSQSVIPPRNRSGWNVPLMTPYPYASASGDPISREGGDGNQGKSLLLHHFDVAAFPSFDNLYLSFIQRASCLSSVSLSHQSGLSGHLTTPVPE